MILCAFKTVCMHSKLARRQHTAVLEHKRPLFANEQQETARTMYGMTKVTFSNKPSSCFAIHSRHGSNEGNARAENTQIHLSEVIRSSIVVTSATIAVTTARFIFAVTGILLVVVQDKTAFEYLLRDSLLARLDVAENLA